MSFQFSADLTSEYADDASERKRSRYAGQRFPRHPSPSEIAALVSELFTEGTLTWDQFSTLERLPELNGLLSEPLARVPHWRRNKAGNP